MADQRLPIVNSDDGVWGDIIRQYLMKEHYDTGSDNPANGGHKNVTIRAGVATAGGAPLVFTSGTLLTTPEAGAFEFAGDHFYATSTTGPTRKKLAIYDDTSGATGDIYYRNSGGYFTRLGAGSTGDFLTIASGIPSWTASIVSKALDNTNTITVKDNNFTLQDNSDTTKQVQFELSGITTSTTRTLTIPNASTTIVGTDTIQTLTNKTLTNPRVDNILDANGNPILYLAPIASAVNYVQLNNHSAGNMPALTAIGTDTNISLNLASKGTGKVQVNSVDVVTVSDTQSLTSKTLSTGTVVSVLPTGAGVASAATSSTLAARDASANLSADAFVPGFTTTPTAGTTTTLTVDSTEVQQFTGSTTQTVALPTTSIVAGQRYTITNQSTGTVTVQTSGANNLIVLVASVGTATFTALQAAPTAAAHWQVDAGQSLQSSANASASTLVARDTRANIFADAFIPALTSTATSGITTTLTVDDREVQVFTGSSIQTVQLPTTSIGAGYRLTLINNSSGVVTVNSSGANLVVSLPGGGTSAVVVANTATPTTAAHWSVQYSPVATDIVTLTGTQTLTNKRITSRVGTTTSTATPTINSDSFDVYTITALATNITNVTVTGTPTDGQKLRVAITGTATRTIAWGSSFEASSVALPTTTNGTARLDADFVWNTTTSKWRVAGEADPAAVTLTGVQTLTNKTLTDPKTDAIYTTAGKLVLGFQYVAGAGTNSVNIANGYTGVAPTIFTEGVDTNVDLGLVTKGSGVVKANSIEVATISGTQTLTNKRITSRVGTTTSTATPAINTDSYDAYTITALATNISS